MEWIPKQNSLCFWKNEERLRHTQVLGATGFGKTESVLLPLMRHDIMTGKGLMVIDAKADEKLLKQIVSMAKDYGRVNDIKYFSPTMPEKSWTYNPFDGDDQTVVSEKLISALDWSEQFYKKVSQHAVLAIAHTLILAKQPVTVHSLLEGLKNPQGLLIHGVTNDLLKYLLEHHKKNRDHYAGLITDLENLVSTSFGPLMVNSPTNIDLLKAYSNNHIVIFQASSLQFPETARALGKLLLRDIMCLVSKIYTEVPASRRKFFPVYIDEFGSFAIPAFAECMRMMRASGVNAVTEANLTSLRWTKSSTLNSCPVTNSSSRNTCRRSKPKQIFFEEIIAAIESASSSSLFTSLTKSLQASSVGLVMRGNPDY